MEKRNYLINKLLNIFNQVNIYHLFAITYSKRKKFILVTEREIRRGTIENNRSNVIGIIRDFSNPIIETAIDGKFFGKIFKKSNFSLIFYSIKIHQKMNV